MNTFKSLEEKIDNAKDLDFSNLFDSIIELFKKVWLKGFLTILLIVIFNYKFSEVPSSSIHVCPSSIDPVLLLPPS